MPWDCDPRARAYRRCSRSSEVRTTNDTLSEDAMIRWLLALSAGALPVAHAHAQGRPAPKTTDWDAIRTEAAGLLSEYLRINTTNPPGNELQGALFL